jgi:hypothetical protein
MTDRPLLLNKRFWFWVLKCFVLLFVGSMIVIQIPELRYDMSDIRPIEISNPDELERFSIRRATFVSVRGRANFEKAFVYQRYGLNYTYFIIEPYGLHLVSRTYEKVTDEWEDLNRFLGKLRPFDDQAFSYRIREIFYEQFEDSVPQDAYFLGLDDIPKPSGWQIGAVSFASVLWGVMFYLFFFFFPRRLGNQGNRNRKTTQ